MLNKNIDNKNNNNNNIRLEIKIVDGNNFSFSLVAIIKSRTIDRFERDEDFDGVILDCCCFAIFKNKTNNKTFYNCVED